MAKECFVLYLVEMVLEKKNKNDKSLQTDQRHTKYKIKHVKSYKNTSVQKKTQLKKQLPGVCNFLNQ